MKFNCLHIKPAFGGKGWEVLLDTDETDRMNEPTVPNSLGFYYYPARKGTQFAFNALKGMLISRHREEINRLQRSLDALYALQNPYEIK